MLRRLFALCLASACVFQAVAGGSAARASAVDTLVAEAGKHRLIMLGEMHGTREIPPLVGEVAEHLSREGPLLLALEIHASEHASLRAYLDGDGSVAQRDLLRRRPFWSVPQQRNDGRRSEDMLDLVERMRQLRAQGRDVAVLAYDVANGGGPIGDWRDDAMAAQLRQAFGALPRGPMLVLTGNVHAMRLRPSWAPEQMPAPMTAGLLDLQPVSIEIAAASGEFWACPAAGCGPQRIVAVPSAGALPAGEPFDYRIVLPAFSVARPVKPAGAATSP
ncbi:calcium-binding protein [Xanthomonas sp. XNM01]|uniref:calcium-binding protein n=1 Tax=Xanthomonas sp. XNM01 TaxID=2769289 RepID=UPI00177CFBFB|nr:calcium-binding protein [Xanthomonas sp. XNM01]MBD9369896.1 calcium-binding protein [Xanthomonas sp. XNM01]